MKYDIVTRRVDQRLFLLKPLYDPIRVIQYCLIISVRCIVIMWNDNTARFFNNKIQENQNIKTSKSPKYK